LSLESVAHKGQWSTEGNQAPSYSKRRGGGGKLSRLVFLTCRLHPINEGLYSIYTFASIRPPKDPSSASFQYQTTEGFLQLHLSGREINEPRSTNARKPSRLAFLACCLHPMTKGLSSVCPLASIERPKDSTSAPCQHQTFEGFLQLHLTGREKVEPRSIKARKPSRLAFLACRLHPITKGLPSVYPLASIRRPKDSLSVPCQHQTNEGFLRLHLAGREPTGPTSTKARGSESRVDSFSRYIASSLSSRDYIQSTPSPASEQSPKDSSIATRQHQANEGFLQLQLAGREPAGRISTKARGE
jgi:hypothetical protein